MYETRLISRSSRPLSLVIMAALVVLLAFVLSKDRAGSSSLAARALSAQQAPFVETEVASADAVAGDNFGRSVSLSGNILVVGAYSTDVGNQEGAGAAYVFTRGAADSTQWSQVARLTAGDGKEFDLFGASTAIDGDTIVVGATHVDVDGHTAQGAAYVFERDQGGPNQWGEVKKLTGSTGGDFDNFGDSLAVQGDEIFVGAFNADVGGVVAQGAVFVFGRNEGGAGNWGEAGKLTDPDGKQGDSFGSAIGVDGDWLVAGAARADVTGALENDGAALLFKKDSQSGDWLYQTTVSASDADGSERFGASAALQGERLMVGAPAAERNGKFSVGKAYLFERNHGGQDAWGEVKMLVAGDGVQFDSFGISVALGPDEAYVGASAADVDLIDEGAVYVFEQDQGGPGAWQETHKLAAGDGKPDDLFGRALFFAADTLAAGARLADDGTDNNKGKAYAYTPAEMRYVYMPALFEQSFSFSATGVLEDGGVVSGPDGIKLGAVPGALSEDLPVSIRGGAPPADPLPSRASPVGDYYRIAAEREALQPLDRSFVLALPVPDGADTEHLAIAVYASTKSALDLDNPRGHYWAMIPGVYDAAEGLLLAQFPYLSQVEETVVLVEHPDMLAVAKGTGARMAAASPANRAAGNFKVVCNLDNCSADLIKEVENLLQQQFADFLINYKYPQPRMVGTSSDFSVDPPELKIPSDVYFAFIFPKTEPGCIDSENKPAYAGQYGPERGDLWICVQQGAKSLSAHEKDTLRHEYFHALEYAYDDVLSDRYSGEAESWIIEGLAEAVIKSGSDWMRSGANDIRPVDKPLRDDSGVLEYQAEDFWVYAGRNRIPGGIEWLKQILNGGATFDDVFNNLDFDDSYWLWVRNQAIEKSDNMNGTLGAKCQLETDAVSQLQEWDIIWPYNQGDFVGHTSILSSSVVELKFSDEFAGLEANIRATALPESSPTPLEFKYKVYRTPWPSCSGTPDNVPQKYKITPGERYFVVLANTHTDGQILWKISFE